MISQTSVNKATETDAMKKALSRSTESGQPQTAGFTCSGGSEKASPKTHCCSWDLKDEQS